ATPQPKATSGKAPAAKAGTAKPGPKPAAAKAKPESPTFSELRRDLFRRVIVAGGEIVKEFPASERAELAQALANQLHHLTRQDPKAKNGGWPGALPKPIRSDWA